MPVSKPGLFKIFLRVDEAQVVGRGGLPAELAQQRRHLPAMVGAIISQVQQGVAEPPREAVPGKGDVGETLRQTLLRERGDERVLPRLHPAPFQREILQRNIACPGSMARGERPWKRSSHTQSAP